MTDRILHWEGCNNIRDLGGLRTTDGRLTRRGAIIRGDTPKRLTAEGWAALYAYGIRTIITLRTHGMTEDDLDFTPPYPEIVTLPAPIEDITDMEFVEKSVNTNLWGTPLYFKDALRRWPERHAAVISAIGRAQPGGVLFHCIRGYDRTGIISLLLLALAGVEMDEIVDDYELSVDPLRDEFLVQEKTSVRAAMLEALEGLDLEHYFVMGGASQDEVAAVRKRLLE
jgi:protein-tyrosine phosphatase